MKYIDDSAAAELVSKLVPATRTVNGKALSSDVTLEASDVSAYSRDELDAKLSAFSTDVCSVGATAPSNTKLLWVDTTSGSVLKYYNPTTGEWTAVDAVWG